MFTGLVREVGRVTSFEDGRLRIESTLTAAIGDSVAIAGVCLTVVDGDRRRGQPRDRRACQLRRAPDEGYDLSMATSAEERVFASIEEAIDDGRNGRFVVVVDDPDRENEGDLVIAGQFATPEAINFMA